MLNVSLTFYLGTCWAAKACLRMGRRSSLSSPKSSLYSINISSIYRSCRGRNRVPYSPPCPQPEHPALLQLPNIHSLIWWHCPLPHSQATPKESMILPSSNHGNPAWKSQLLSILKISVFQLPLFGFRFWHLHSGELSWNSPFLSIAGVASRFPCFDESCVMFFVSVLYKSVYKIGTRNSIFF